MKEAATVNHHYLLPFFIEALLLFNIENVLKILERVNNRFVEPIVTTISRKQTPFHVLISCLLSLRTKDQTTREASATLYHCKQPARDTQDFNTRVRKAHLSRWVLPDKGGKDQRDLQ